MQINSLRKKYPRFVYKSYSYRISKKDLEIFFDFKVSPDIAFNPKIVIKNVSNKQIRKIGKRALNTLVFNLGLVELISYWKATCSPEIEVKAGNLSQNQIAWWKNLIMNGLGEFFYKNKIDFKAENFLKIISNNEGPETSRKAFNLINSKEALVLIGGGKDSIVTLEILKKYKRINCFCLNPTQAADSVMKTAGYTNPIIVKRVIDPKLLELNRAGFLNGHTPISAYLAFLSVLTAAIFNKKYVIVSNERSSNEENLIYLGQKINHQYSKSFEFEKNFRKYSRKYLASNIEYFSFLRPLYEIQITKLFSQYSKYFKVFVSCNEAFKTKSGQQKPTKKWCGKCPKCLFVFSCLYPFVKKNDLTKIFGENLFEKKELLPLMQELIGMKKFKPFECVGTKKETLVALYLSWNRSRRELEKMPYLLKYFKEKILPQYPRTEKEVKRIMTAWNKKHCLPAGWEKALRL